MVERTAAGLLLAVVVLLMPAPTALAAAPDPDRRVWDAYPLPTPESERPASTAAVPQSEMTAAPSDELQRLVIASLLALMAGGLTTWLVSLRWPLVVAGPVRAAAPRQLPAPRRPPAPELWVHEPEPAEPIALVPAADAEVSSPSPPDHDRPWVAEIGWHTVDGGAQFRIAAHPLEGGAQPVTLGASPVLDWPPGDAGAVQALTDAVKALEASMVSAGWAPLPRGGGAWYAKRFNWQPGARSRPVPPARTRHRDLYETEFARQVDRTERLRETIAARLIEQQGTAVTRE
jgi:hypothetical protein